MVAAALHKTGSYSEHELALFEKELHFREIEQGAFILKPGEIAKSAFYIVTGAVYQYRVANEIDHVILDLGTDDKWMVDHKSFVDQQPSDCYLKATEKSQILELNIDSIHKLIALSPSFFQLGRLLDSNRQRLIFLDQSLSPIDKYQCLLAQSPQILQKFPLKMIASYLRVTPETLSRVRKKIVAPSSSS